jgi:hypothetical protein
VIYILNDFLATIRTPIKDLQIPRCTFLLGGYSWIQKRFRIWLIKYHKELKRFYYDEARNICGQRQSILFAGDAGPRLMNETARILTERRGKQWGTIPLDLEPLEALAEMLRASTDADSIGGPPQLVKIYQHTNTAIIPLYWPRGQRESVCYLGRKLVGYEHLDDWVLDLSDMTKHPHTLGAEPRGSSVSKTSDMG